MDAPINTQNNVQSLVQTFNSMEDMQVDWLFNEQTLTFAKAEGTYAGFQWALQGLLPGRGYPKERRNNLEKIQSIALEVIRSLSESQNDVEESLHQLAMIQAAFFKSLSGLKQLSEFKYEARFYHSEKKLQKLVQCTTTFQTTISDAIELKFLKISSKAGNSSNLGQSFNLPMNSQPISSAPMKRSENIPPPPKPFKAQVNAPKPLVVININNYSLKPIEKEKEMVEVLTEALEKRRRQMEQEGESKSESKSESWSS